MAHFLIFVPAAAASSLGLGLGERERETRRTTEFLSPLQPSLRDGDGGAGLGGVIQGQGETGRGRVRQGTDWKGNATLPLTQPLTQENKG